MKISKNRKQLKPNALNAMVDEIEEFVRRSEDYLKYGADWDDDEIMDDFTDCYSVIRQIKKIIKTPIGGINGTREEENR